MERRSLLLGESRPSAALGVTVAIGVVAAITALIYPLRQVMPAVSTGVIYLLAVLAISTFWGLRLGLLTSLLSATAFNFFHIPPTGRFHIAEAENWVALGAFFVAAVLASSVAELARARADEAELRRREAVLAAEMARLLLGGRRATDALEETATRLAEALELPRARIVLAASTSSDPGARSIPLLRGNATMGTLLVPADSEPQILERLYERIVPALETLLSAALERERLQAEAVEADALRRSDEIKTAVLRSVSHDLRTPLTAIVASGDALASAGLSSDERKALSEALTGEASRLARLVDQLLDLSRLEAGAAEPRRDWCSIEEIALVAVEQAGEPSQFELSVDRDLPLLHADAAQLERALVNVLENAARHSGERRVSLKARAVDSKLVMRVLDSGPGIPESELERVFQPFHRGDGASPPGHQGSGLGLAIAKGFIDANGGRIWAESLPGQGTTIVIELPVPFRSAGDPHVPSTERVA
jgi:two-component system sensor histidine kinase KdpD